MPQYNPLEGLNIPSGQYLPPEYSQQMLGQLQIGQERQEKDTIRKFLEGINSMGRMYTGSALRSGIEQVLGPQMERQQQLLGGIALQGAGMGREERITEQGQQWQGEQRNIQNEWQAAQNEITRQMQERQFQEQMAAQRAAARKGSRFSTQLAGALPQLAIGALSGGLGGAVSALPSLFGGSQETSGGYLPQDLSSDYSYPWQKKQSTNMFGRNLGYGY